MRREYWDIKGNNPSYRINAVMETYCDKNSRHSLMGIEPKGYNPSGQLTGFDVLYEITEGFENEGYSVETHKHADAMNWIQDRINQGYDVYPIKIDNEKTTVVSVKKSRMMEQDYSTRKR